MTEEEARQKWCPFVRITISEFPETGNVAVNVGPKGSRTYDQSRCIASDCMAWRTIKMVEHNVMRDTAKEFENGW